MATRFRSILAVLVVAWLWPASALAEITVTWANSYGTASTSARINATAVDGSGNVYVAGYFDGATLAVGTTTLTRIGTQDAFVAKLDSSGATVWAQNFGGGGASATGAAVAVDSSGNVYVGGYFSTADLDTPGLTLIGSQDAFALKLNSIGTTITWSQNFGGNTGGVAAYGYAIAVDGSGNVYVGGSFSGGDLTTPALTSIAFTNAFALKLDSGGTTIPWAQTIGGGSTEGKAIAVDGSGSVYVGGYFSGADLTTPAPLTKIGILDAFVFKLDSSNGTTTWGKNFGGASQAVFGYAVAVDGSGNVYLGGTAVGALTTPALTPIGTNDVFAFKLNSSGTTIWARNFGGAGATAAGNAIAVDGSGNVYVGGYFTVVSLTTPALTRVGNQDAFALKLDSSGAITSAKNFGGTGATAYGPAIAVDGSGNVHLGGYFAAASLTTPALTRVGSNDAFIIKAATVHYALTVTISGTGTVTSSPAGISCGSICSADFATGTSVTLTATAEAGHTFSAWSGACSGSGTATVSMTQARACTATFVATPPPSWLGTNGNGQLNFSSLEVTVGANGQISTAIPSGNFNTTGLTFTATQADGSALPSWLSFDPATLSFTGTVPALAASTAASGPARPFDVAASSGRWLATAPRRVAVRLTISLRVSDAMGQSTTVRFPFVAHYPRSQATVVAISVTDTGVGANGVSAASALSDDGQAVVFQVTSTNLVPGDSGSTPDVFRYDVASGVLDRFSTGSFMGTIAGRAQGWSGSPAVSADARTIAFASDAANVGTVWNFGPRQVWVADASAARVSTVTPSPSAASAAADGSLANGASDNPSLSETGRYVAFESEATNLVAGTSTAVQRVYVKDRTTGAVVLAGTGRRPSIAGDGGSVAFDDETTVYRKDLVLGTVVTVGLGTLARLSRDGRYVAFQSGGSVLRADLSTSATATVAEGSAPSMSADGRFVAYVSQDQVRVRDMAAGTDELVSTATGGGAGNGASSDPAISGDGRLVSFASAATDLVASMTGTQLYVAGNPLLTPLATGWWWNPGEPGRGFAVETRGDQLMLGTLLYASDGSPVWYLASGAVTSSSFASALQQYQGGQTLGGAYRVASVLGSVGTTALAISSRSEATASGALSTSLQRFEFSSGGVTAGPQLGSPEGGWWWNPDGPGTGWYLEIQNATMFLAGFLYDAGGTATWVWAVGSMSTSRTFTGTLSRCTGGQTLGGAYQTATCSADQGTVTLAFSSPIAAALTLPTGGRIALGRFRF